MARLHDRLAALVSLPPGQLRDEWERVCETAPPRLPPDLLRLGIAHRLQENAGRAMSATTLRRLRAPAEAPERRPASWLSPGTQLIRSWHGRTISVAVEEKGFLFEGRRYASLTAIAREVTGAGWSGPRFFGLTGAQARG